MAAVPIPVRVIRVPIIPAIAVSTAAGGRRRGVDATPTRVGRGLVRGHRIAAVPRRVRRGIAASIAGSTAIRPVAGGAIDLVGEVCPSFPQVDFLEPVALPLHLHLVVLSGPGGLPTWTVGVDVNVLPVRAADHPALAR